MFEDKLRQKDAASSLNIVFLLLCWENARIVCEREIKGRIHLKFDLYVSFGEANVRIKLFS
jgi:hypothetical protein